MSKRYLVLGLSVVLALSLAVPALGGPSNPIADISASAKKTATKALKKAKAAQKTANSALTEAKKGVSDAATAQGSANSAKATADSAKAAADSAKALAEEANAAAAAAEANANSRIAGSYINFGEASPNDTGSPKFAGAECDSGSDPILGGGFSVGGTDPNEVTVTQNIPDPLYGDSWFVQAQAISGTPTWSLQAVIMCGFN